MNNYYEKALNSDKLFSVYDTSIPRVRQYLDAEIDFVRGLLKPTDHVLELGAGYGRILRELAPYAMELTGVEISAHSVELGREYLRGTPNCSMLAMDANQLQLDRLYDVVLCLQNAISAMKVPPNQLIQQCLALLKPGGQLMLSTYSERFWPHRLEWFREQSAKGLIGPIDEARTGDGIIQCTDGFRAITFSPLQLQSLGEASGFSYSMEEVDASSLFLIIVKPET